MSHMSSVDNIAKEPVTRFDMELDYFGRAKVQFRLKETTVFECVWTLHDDLGYDIDDIFIATVCPDTGIVQDVRYHPRNRKHPIWVYRREFVELSRNFMIRGEFTHVRQDLIWSEQVAKNFYLCYLRLLEQYPTAPPQLNEENKAIAEYFIEAMESMEVMVAIEGKDEPAPVKILPTNIISSSLTDSW